MAVSVARRRREVIDKSVDIRSGHRNARLHVGATKMARSANAARLLLSLLAGATLLLQADRTAAVEATIDVVGACPDADAVRHLLSMLLSANEASAAPLSIQDRGAR